jgi:hypothetical protein
MNEAEKLLDLIGALGAIVSSLTEAHSVTDKQLNELGDTVIEFADAVRTTLENHEIRLRGLEGGEA